MQTIVEQSESWRTDNRIDILYFRRMRVLQDIRPTAEQLVILRDAATGFRLIRGAAGSGKTTAALMRLRQLCAARAERRRRLGLPDPVRVLVLTFNRTLRGYVEHLASGTGRGVGGHRPDGGDISHWALGLCEGQRESSINNGSFANIW